MKSLIYIITSKYAGWREGTKNYHLRVYLIDKNIPTFLCEVQYSTSKMFPIHHEAIREHLNKNNLTIEFDGIYEVA